MQRVGELVRFGADEAGLRAVLGEVELTRGHARESSREVLHQRGVQRLREGLGATHEVLEEARLRLVHAHRGAALEGGQPIDGVHVLLVEGVPALVQHREDVGEDVVLVGVARDDHKARGGAARERVLGAPEPERLRVQAFDVNEVARERPLALHVVVALHVGVLGLGGTCHAVGQKRDHTVLDLGKEAVIERAVAAGLVVVQPDVVGVALGVAAGGHALARGHDAVEVGREGRPVVHGLGPAPDVLRLAGELGELGLLLGGDPHEGVAVAREHAHLGVADVAQQLRRCGEALEDVAHVRVAQGENPGALQLGERLGAPDRRLGRVDDRAKGADLVERVVQREERALKRVERLDVCLWVGERRVDLCHGSPFARVSSRWLPQV